MQQNEPFELPDDLNDFARQLASFKASSSMLNRDEILFQSGQAEARAKCLAEVASVRRSLRIWQCAALVLCAFSVGLGTSLTLNSARPVESAIADRDLPMVAPDAMPPQRSDLLSASESTAVTSRQRQEGQGVEKSSRAVPQPFDRNVLEGTQRKLALIERLIEGGSSAENLPATPNESIKFAQRHHPDFALSYRSLLRGDESRSLIHRIIEEPNL